MRKHSPTARSRILGCENGNSRPILIASPSRRLADIVSEFRPLSLGTLRGLTGHILTTIRPKELLCLISPRASGILSRLITLEIAPRYCLLAYSPSTSSYPFF